MPKQQLDLRSSQIICGGMLIGILIFLAVACVLAREPSAAESLPGWLCATILASLFVGIWGARVVIGAAIGKAAARAAEAAPDRAAREAELEHHYGALTLLTLALLEGLAFTGLVFLMLTGLWWLLAAPIFAIAAGIPLAPTRGRCDAFAQAAGGR